MKTSKLSALFVLLMCFCACATTSYTQPATNAVAVKQWDGSGWTDQVVSSGSPAAIVIGGTPGLSTLPTANIATTSAIASSSAALSGEIASALATATTFTSTFFKAGDNITITGGTIAASGEFPLIGGDVSITNPNVGSLELNAQLLDLNSSGDARVTADRIILKSYDKTDLIVGYPTGSVRVFSDPGGGEDIEYRNVLAADGTADDHLTTKRQLDTKLDASVWTTGSADLQTQINARLTDAPNDGKQYARQNGYWAQVVGGGTTPPYVLPPATNTSLGGISTGVNNSVSLNNSSGVVTLPTRLGRESSTYIDVANNKQSGFFKTGSSYAYINLYLTGSSAAKFGYDKVTGKWNGEFFSGTTSGGVSDFVQEAPKNSKPYNRADGVWVEALPWPTVTGTAQVMRSGTWGNVLPIIGSDYSIMEQGGNLYINKGTAANTAVPHLFLGGSHGRVGYISSSTVGSGVRYESNILTLFSSGSISFRTYDFGNLQNIEIAPAVSGSHAVTKSQLDTKQDILTAGSGITIAGGTISATGGGGGSYTLPIATSSTLGGVMIGSGIDIVSGTISSTWPTGSTALQTSITNALTTATTFTSTFHKAGSGITITGGTISASGTFANNVNTSGSYLKSGTAIFQIPPPSGTLPHTVASGTWLPLVSGSNITIVGGTISATGGGGGGGGFPINGDNVSITNPGYQELIITGSTDTGSGKVTIRAENGSDPLEYIGPGTIILDAGDIVRKIGINSLKVPTITAVGGSSNYEITRNLVFTPSMTGTTYALPMQHWDIGTHIILCTNLSGKNIKVTWDSEMSDTTIANGQTKIFRLNAEGGVDEL